jgi:hypothetical protein
MSTLYAFKRGEPPIGLAVVLDMLRDTAQRRRIRCPTCGWQPEGSSRWFCVETGAPEHFAPGCGTAWNTFETRGRCPGCSHLWTWTACLSCGAWARHDEWYAPEDDDEITG